MSKLNTLIGMLNTVDAFHPERVNTEYRFIVTVREDVRDMVSWAWASPTSLELTAL